VSGGRGGRCRRRRHSQTPCRRRSRSDRRRRRHSKRPGRAPAGGGGPARGGARQAPQAAQAAHLRSQRRLRRAPVHPDRQLRVQTHGREDRRLRDGHQPRPGRLPPRQPEPVRRGLPEQHGGQPVCRRGTSAKPSGVRLRGRGADGRARDVGGLHAVARREGGLAGVRPDDRRARRRPSPGRRARAGQAGRPGPPADPDVRRPGLRVSRRVLPRARSVFAQARSRAAEHGQRQVRPGQRPARRAEVSRRQGLRAGVGPQLRARADVLLHDRAQPGRVLGREDAPVLSERDPVRPGRPGGAHHAQRRPDARRDRAGEARLADRRGGVHVPQVHVLRDDRQDRRPGPELRRRPELSEGQRGGPQELRSEPRR